MIWIELRVASWANGQTNGRNDSWTGGVPDVANSDHSSPLSVVTTLNE